MNIRTETAERNIFRCDEFLFCSLLVVLFLIPLIFSPSLYRSFEIPKVVLLRTGATLLLLGWWLLPMRHRFLDLLRASTIVQAVLLVLAAAAIATCLSIEPILSIFGIYDRQLGFLSMTAMTVLFVIVVEQTGFSRKRAAAVVRTLNIAATVAAGYAVAQYCGIDPFPWSDAFGPRSASTVGHPDYLGDLLVMSMPLCLAMVYSERQWWVRVMWFFCFVVQAGGLLVSQTRGAWIAAAVTVPLFIAVEPFFHRESSNVFRRHALVSGAALVAVLAAGSAVFLTHPPLRERAVSIVHVEEQPRLYLWRDSMSVIKEYPLTGTGPQTFRLAFMPYKSLELARLEHNTNYDTPHNNYLHVWATTGALGICAYLYLIFCCFRTGIRTIVASSDCNDSILSLGLVIALAAYVMAMVTGIDTIATMLYLYVLAGLVAAGELPPSMGGRKVVAKSKVEERKSVRSLPGMDVNQSGGSFKKGLIALVLIFVVAMSTYDSARMVRADNRALAGLRAAHNGTTAGSSNGQNLLEQAAALLPRESFYPLQAGVVALKKGYSAEDRNKAFTEAIMWAERSFKHGWAPENSWNLISTAYLNLGNWTEAEQACRQGLALGPNNGPLMFNLAKALAIAGKKEEALLVIDQLLLVNERFVEAQELQGRLMGEE